MRSVVDFYECLQCKTSFCMHIILPTGLTVLAQYPNVYCKVSGLCTADKSWTVQTYVENSAKPCMEIFGKDRYIGIFIIAMRISRGNKKFYQCKCTTDHNSKIFTHNIIHAQDP